MGKYLDIRYCCERILALLLLVILCPLLMIISVFVGLFVGWPIMFTQERTGYKEKSFLFYKFLSMNQLKGRTGQLLPDQQRLTAFGSFLRKTSLDELPQLFNILKGDMSFIGPRPLIVDYLSRYNSHQRRRHNVKPGMTGLAQVKGRNRISWKEKFEYDVYYIDHVSLMMDVMIVFKTMIKVLGFRDVNASSENTMETFYGKN